MHVRQAELPVLVRLIDARKESLPLFLFGEVEKYLDDPGSIAMQMPLQIDDRAITPVPDGFLVAQFFRQSLAAKQLRMHANYQYILVIGTIEDADPPAFGKAAVCTPEEIVVQFLSAWLLETENLASLRIDARHNVPDGPILAGPIHPLKDQKQSVLMRRIMKLLQGTQLRDIFCEEVVILGVRWTERFDRRRPLAEFYLGWAGLRRSFHNRLRRCEYASWRSARSVAGSGRIDPLFRWQ